MHVWVTGGAGFIGSHIVNALLDAGHEVTVIDDLSTGSRANIDPRARFFEVDIRDAAALRDAFLRSVPAVVCHQAAQTSVSVSTREPLFDASVNIVGALHLLELCREAKIARVVFASTGGAIYGEVDSGAADESTPPVPISPYACSKLAFEGYLGAYRHEHDLPSTVLRYANVYGPRQDPHGEAGVVAIFMQRLIAGEPIKINARRAPGDGGCIRDYVFVRDVVRANLLAIEGRLGSSPLNVGTGVGTSTEKLAGTIATALAVSADSANAPRRAGDLERSVLSPNDELAAALGAPTTLEEGIAETAAWFRQRAGSGGAESSAR